MARNPIVGCKHFCRYCWARKLANTRLKRYPQYAEGFDHPHLVRHKLSYHGRNQTIFCCDMGDAFGNWVPREWILAVLKVVQRANPSNTFFFETKNPARYHEFIDEFPSNVILSTTIESNIDHHVTKAPSPYERYNSFRKLSWPMKHLAIEPIQKFDLDTFVQWVDNMNLWMVSVGWCNKRDYSGPLPEPTFPEAEELVGRLRKVTDIRLKSNYEEKRRTYEWLRKWRR